MLYLVLFGVILLLNLLLSLIVLLKNPKKHLNVAFFLFVISLILWMITNYLSNKFTDPVSALFFNKLIFIFSPYIVFSLVYFSLVFPLNSIKLNKLGILLLLIPVFISNILTWKNRVITDVTFLPDGGTGVVFGPAAVFFVAQFLIYLLATLIILIKKYRKSHGYERAQMQYITFGIGATMLLTAITNLIIPLTLNNFLLSNIGPFFTLIMVGSISYAIIRHKLLDIRLIIARSVLYVLLILLIAILYIVGVFVISQYVFRLHIDIQQVEVHALLAVFVAFTFVPLRSYIENATSRIFFKGGYDQHDFVFQLTRIIASTISLETVTTKTLQKLLSTIGISHGTFLILKKNRQFAFFTKGRKIEKYNQEVIDVICSLKRMVIFDEEKNTIVKDLMRQLDLAIILPLYERHEKVGVLLLGGKRSGQIYSQRDIGVLEIFGPAVSIAIQNAKSYEEISKFNQTLKNEVNIATRNLQKANLKLIELGKQKDDFIAIASHELKTPVTSIKLYLQLLQRKFEKEKDMKSAGAIAKMDGQLNKLINLINDLLDVTKIEEGKLQFNLETFKLNELVKEVVEEMHRMAKHTIVQDLDSVEAVTADRERVGQVLTNFMTNAIKYSPDANKIIVKTKKEKNRVTVAVQDFGLGLSKDDQKKVFERFNRAGQEGKGGYPGLGLGLYISKEIITRHNGQIWVESTKGKGSIFYFTLPLRPKLK